MINSAWGGYCCRSRVSITSRSCCLRPSCTVSPLALCPFIHQEMLTSADSSLKAVTTRRKTSLEHKNFQMALPTTHTTDVQTGNPRLSLVSGQRCPRWWGYCGFWFGYFLASFGIRTVSTKLGERGSHTWVFFPKWNTKTLQSPEKHDILQQEAWLSAHLVLSC